MGDVQSECPPAGEKLTLTETGAETIQVGGKDVSCHTFDVFPISNKFWIDDATGELVKDTDPRQNLVITKD